MYLGPSVITACLSLLLVACSDEAPPSTTASTPPATVAVQEDAPAPAVEAAPAAALPTDWQEAGVEKAAALAEKLRAAGISCDSYAVRPAGAFLEDYHSRIKVPVGDLPLAESSCTSADEEDLAFSIFPGEANARSFIDAKRRKICGAMARRGIKDFPGFAYVIGDGFVVEPDERVTSVAIAPILGGTAAMATCEDFFPPAP